MDGVSLKLAVLIDGDNVAAEAMDRLFATIRTLGDPVVRIVYRGQTPSRKWQQAANHHALRFGRRHPHLTGRNATDMEMVIGAMDLLMCVTVDGFCVVSSDADFTPLAIRLQENGKRVFGFGCGNAPQSLRRACHAFHVLEQTPKQKPAPPAPAAPRPLAQATDWLIESFHACASEGAATLAVVGGELRHRHPGFSPRNYGSAGLKKLINACGVFDLDVVGGRDVFRLKQTEKALKLVKI